MVVLTAARPNLNRFVASRLFDNFSGPWVSLLDTLLCAAVVDDVVVLGASADAYKMVERMNGRFCEELTSVLASSNLFRRKFFAFVSCSSVHYEVDECNMEW